MKLDKMLLGVTLAILVTGANAQNIPTNGLVAYYPFNGDANDATGNGHNGVNVGSGISFGVDQASNPTSAVHFTGSGHIEVTPTPFDVNSDYTIGFWTKLDSPGSSVNNFLSTGGEVNGAFDVRFITTSTGWQFFSTGTTGTINAATPNNYTAWHAVVCVRQDSNSFLYVDNVLRGTNQSQGPTLDTGSLWIGQHNLSGFPYSVVGSMDDLRIYNRALSSNEIAQVSVPQPHGATGIAILSGNFVTGVTITDHGYGYTNVPRVRFFGGSGSGAQATATVSNYAVSVITQNSAGSGYTSVPVVVIDPPFIPQPILNIASVTVLTFSNLTVNTNYQLQKFQGWYWTNIQSSFMATSNSTQLTVTGGSDTYRLAQTPVPLQAFANPQVVNGFVVGATIPSPSHGSGYSNAPNLNIVGGSGSNAVGIVQVSGSGTVTNIQMLNAGFGYTIAPILEIDPPPAIALAPDVQPGVRIDASALAPYDNYQYQSTADLNQGWQNFNAVFNPTAVSNSQAMFTTNGAGLFRLLHVP